MYKLYYSSGACSLSPHIALREAGLPFELERVDLRGKLTASGEDFRTINPKGYVPALRLPDGQILTEGVAMVQYIADQAPAARLAPPPASFERVRLQEWLNFIATELHKGLSPLYSPIATEEFKQSVRERVTKRIEYVAEQLGDRPYLIGDFSIADGYLFYTLRGWQMFAKGNLESFPNLAAYYARMESRPSVKAALAAEAAR